MSAYTRFAQNIFKKSDPSIYESILPTHDQISVKKFDVNTIDEKV